MTASATPERQPALEPVDDALDHVRGPASGRLIVEYGDHRHKALGNDDLHRYAAGLGLDVAHFADDRASAEVRGRVRRDVESGIASGEVLGTPTLFIDEASAPRWLRRGHLAEGTDQMSFLSPHAHLPA